MVTSLYKNGGNWLWSSTTTVFCDYLHVYLFDIQSIPRVVFYHLLFVRCVFIVNELNCSHIIHSFITYIWVWILTVQYKFLPPSHRPHLAIKPKTVNTKNHVLANIVKMYYMHRHPLCWCRQNFTICSWLKCNPTTLVLCLCRWSCVDFIL